MGADSTDSKPEYLNIAEAGKYLGVSHYKISLLIAQGKLHTIPDALDARQKLVSKAELDALKALSKRVAKLEESEEA